MVTLFVVEDDAGVIAAQRIEKRIGLSDAHLARFVGCRRRCGRRRRGGWNRRTAGPRAHPALKVAAFARAVLIWKA